MTKNKLIIKELHFDSAHYLSPEFGKCQYLHGHRWSIRDLQVYCSKVVDFGKIKEAVGRFDHGLIVPRKDVRDWEINRDVLPCKLRLIPIDDDLTLVENIKEHVKRKLLEIDGVELVIFTLFETENAGVSSE